MPYIKPHSAFFSFHRTVFLLVIILVANPLPCLSTFCPTNITSIVYSSPNTTSPAFPFDVQSSYPQLPSVAAAGGDTVVLLVNGTKLYSINSITYGATFAQPKLLLSFPNGSVSGIGLVSDGSRFEAIGRINGTLGSMSMLDNQWLVNNTLPNTTIIHPILSVAPTHFTLAAMPGTFIVAAGGGSLSVLSVFVRKSLSLTSSWSQIPCSSCSSTLLPPAVASDGASILVCGLSGTLTACFSSTANLASLVPTLFAPSGIVAGQMALASSGAAGAFVAAYNTGGNVINSQYTLNAGSSAWSTPAQIFPATSQYPILIALAQNTFLASIAASGGGLTFSRLPFISESWFVFRCCCCCCCCWC